MHRKSHLFHCRNKFAPKKNKSSFERNKLTNHVWNSQKPWFSRVRLHNMHIEMRKRIRNTSVAPNTSAFRFPKRDLFRQMKFHWMRLFSPYDWNRFAKFKRQQKFGKMFHFLLLLAIAMVSNTDKPALKTIFGFTSDWISFYYNIKMIFHLQITHFIKFSLQVYFDVLTF